jgi:hypothetical protein
MTALYDALLQGQTDGAVERLLRLLIQNIPRCGDDSHLRRMVVMLASAEGLFGEAQPVVERALSIDIARGDLLGAAATISLASTVGVPTAPLWDRLDDAITDLGFGDLSTARTPDGEPDLEALRPLLSRTGLLHIALEMGARSQPPVDSQFHLTAPLLDLLEFGTLRTLLSRSSLVRHATMAAERPAWTVWARAEAPSVWLPQGTLVNQQTPLAPDSMVLQPDESAWLQAIADPDVAKLWESTLRAKQASDALVRSEVTQALTVSGIDLLVRHGRTATVNRGVARPWGLEDTSLGIVLWGRLDLLDRASDPPVVVDSLSAGDSFGGESGPTLPVAALELRCVEPAAWLSLPPDLTADLLAREAFAESILSDQAERRAARIGR